jgi:NADH dehydrogenase (ubiquinone) 1 alpha subcomplex subunit 2
LANYASSKAKNPDFPLIIREAKGAQPCVMARYEFGVERRVYLHNATEGEVKETVMDLINQGEEINSSTASM